MAPQLAVTETGAGAPLVLLHGIANDSRIWDRVLPELARKRCVLTVDLPGFGRSAPAGAGYVLADVASAILTGLREHGVPEPFDLLGHSLGGAVAIQFAAQHPDGLASLTLVAPAGLAPLPSAVAKVIASRRAASLLNGGIDTALAVRRGAAGLTDLAWGRRLLLGPSVADPARVTAATARAMIDSSLGARRTGAALAAIATTDLRPRLGEIAAPLGVIWGEADRMVPIAGLEDLLAARPDARVVRLPDTGHVPMVERPDAFVATLLSLIDDPSRPATSARPSSGRRARPARSRLAPPS